MESKGIGTKVADFYVNWAYHVEIGGNFEKAEIIFNRGLNAKAESADLLREDMLNSARGFDLLRQRKHQEYDEHMRKRLQKISTLRIDLTTSTTRRANAKSPELDQFDLSHLMTACIPNVLLIQKSTVEHATAVAQDNKVISTSNTDQPIHIPRRNLRQSEFFVPRIMPDGWNEKGPHKFMCNMAEFYPKHTFDEYSLEEIMWNKRKSALATKQRSMTSFEAFNDRTKEILNTGATSKTNFNKTYTKNKPIRPKGHGLTLYKQQMEMARAINRLKIVKPKVLVFEDENDDKANVFIPENLQRLHTPNEQAHIATEFWANAQASIENIKKPVDTTISPHSSWQLTASVQEDINAIQEIINSDSNMDCANIGNYKKNHLNVYNALNQPNGCSTPIKKQVHNFSFSYELLETTAEFERIETLCGQSPEKEHSQPWYRAVALGLL